MDRETEKEPIPLPEAQSMNNRRPYLIIGNFFVDLCDPKPDQIDLEEIDRRHRVMHRFSNDPAAFTVHQHKKLVRLLVENEVLGGTNVDKFHQWAVDWAEYHDDAEAIVGDIPGPLKKLMESMGDHTFARVEMALMRAIYLARGLGDLPPIAVQEFVHDYDKLAETLEWRFHMGRDFGEWNRHVPPHMEGFLRELTGQARDSQ